MHPTRRQLLRWGCAGCAGLSGLVHAAGAGGSAASAGAAASASTTAGDPAGGWQLPARLPRPDLSSEEGGIWGLMEREEQRLRRSSFVVRDPVLQGYLRGVMQRLAGAHGEDVRLYPVRHAEVNATMAPNGMVQVWTGLLLRMENEAQLAAVLGHELGHYLQRHGLEQMRDAKGRTAAMTVMAAFGIVGLLGQLATLAGHSGFSRDQEREADRIGLALMQRAGYDTREAGRLWANLAAESAVSAVDKPSVFFATHPAAEERSKMLSGLAASDGSGHVGREDYLAQLRPHAPQLLDDELRRARPAESLVLLDRMVVLEPARAELFHARGELRRLRADPGDLSLALNDLRQAEALDPTHAPTQRSLGYLHRHNGHAEAARSAFARYVELAPEASDAQLIRSYLQPEGASS